MSLDVLVPVRGGVPGPGWAWLPGGREGSRAGLVPGTGGWAALQPLEAPLLPKHPQPRVGLGLLPFFLACAIYLLVQSSADQPSRVSALLKSLPVFYLAGYRSLLQGALLCSAVGDACLVWPEAFLHGESG